MSDSRQPTVIVIDSDSSDNSDAEDVKNDSKTSTSSSEKASKSGKMKEEQDHDENDESSDNGSDYSFEFTDENCDKRLDEFVEITNTNSALAMFFLQDRKWNVQRAVNDYFVEMKKKEKKGLKRIVLCSKDSSGDEADDEESATPKKKSKTGQSRPSTSSASSVEETDENEPISGKLFRHITWNIDGMQPKNLALRVKAVCDIIVKEKAALVFLQEVTFEAEDIIEQQLGPKYHIFTGFNSTTDYFTLTLVAKGGFFNVRENDILEYENTFMGRNVVKVVVSAGKRKYCLLNSHLESTKEGGEFRLEQFKFMLAQLKMAPRDWTVIAAGDFNLRDKEVALAGGLSNDTVDAWIATGQRKECEFTWDTLRNDTLMMPTKWKPRCRFDRVYIRRSTPPAISLVHFGLIGIERLKPNVCFPSDHWGVITSYKFQ